MSSAVVDRKVRRCHRRPRRRGALRRSAPRSGAEARRACQAATARAPHSRQTLEACRAAAKGSGATPEEQIGLAYALLEQKDVPGALAVAARAEAALWVEQAGPRWWSAMAQLYGRADTCSAAERAASRADGDPAAEQMVADCTRLRRSVGLPRGEGRGVPEAREHEYVAAVQEAQREALRKRTDEAPGRARRIEKAFPGSPGAPLVRCIARAEDRPRARARARAECAAAAEAAPEAIQPQYLLGLVAADEGRWQAARDHLRRAVQFDEGMEVAWVKLATAYQKLGEHHSLEALKAGYQARFGMPLRLPP
jgi:tetratricopeptide (TPR) repeat protein